MEDSGGVRHLPAPPPTGGGSRKNFTRRKTLRLQAQTTIAFGRAFGESMHVIVEYARLSLATGCRLLCTVSCGHWARCRLLYAGCTVEPAAGLRGYGDRHGDRSAEYCSYRITYHDQLLRTPRCVKVVDATTLHSDPRPTRRLRHSDLAFQTSFFYHPGACRPRATRFRECPSACNVMSTVVCHAARQRSSWKILRGSPTARRAKSPEGQRACTVWFTAGSAVGRALRHH